jgi:putative endonuclease
VPRAGKIYFVYILSSLSGTLYIGISNNVQRRSAEHWIGKAKSFTTRYKVDRLVYFETFSDIVKAIARETQIKSWRREKTREEDCAYKQHESVLGRFAENATGEDASLRD